MYIINKKIKIYLVSLERLPIWAWKPVLIFETLYCDWQVLHLITVKRSSFFNNVSGQWHVLQVTYSPRQKKETI